MYGRNSEDAITYTRVTLLIAAAIAISYVDRQTLPVALHAIEAEIPLSNSEFSQLQGAFLLAYAISWVIGGGLIDRIGVRIGFLSMMIWWSVLSAAQGLATGFGGLVAVRFLLGLGEGGAYPAALKTAATFSPQHRSTTMGLAYAGGSLGAMIAPPVVAAAVLLLNWRRAFAVIGALGFIWAACWWRWTTSLAQAARLSGTRQPQAWGALISNPSILVLLLCRFIFYETAFYFGLFWLPKYLYDARGLDTRSVGYYLWIPFAAQALGAFTAGWFSSRMVQLGYPVLFSRKTVMGVFALLTPVIFFVTRVPVQWAIVFLSIAYFAQTASSTMAMVLPADLLRAETVGAAAGLIGSAGPLGGMLFGFFIAYLLDHGFGYGTVFGMVSVFHLLAFCFILIGVRAAHGQVDQTSEDSLLQPATQ